MPNEVLSIAKGWAITTDGLQWMLCRAYIAGGRQYYTPVVFVRSTRAVLEKRMIEKGLNTTIVVKLLKSLPLNFQTRNQSPEMSTETMGGSEKTSGRTGAKGRKERTHQSRKRTKARRA